LPPIAIFCYFLTPPKIAKIAEIHAPYGAPIVTREWGFQRSREIRAKIPRVNLETRTGYGFSAQ
jgi:hypothetical protein